MMMDDQRATCDVLVIGAGAAGLMCAIEAARRGRRVVVIDHADKPAEKIRISGGGRCNFTTLHATHQRPRGDGEKCGGFLSDGHRAQLNHSPQRIR